MKIETSGDFFRQNARANVEIRIQELENTSETSRRRAGLNAKAAAVSALGGIGSLLMSRGPSLEGQLKWEMGALGFLGFAALQAIFSMGQKIEEEESLKLLETYQGIAKQLDAPEGLEGDEDGGGRE